MLVLLFSKKLADARNAMRARLAQLLAFNLLPEQHEQEKQTLVLQIKAFLDDVKGFKYSKAKKALVAFFEQRFDELNFIHEQLKDLRAGKLGVVEFKTVKGESRKYLATKKVTAKKALNEAQNKEYKGGKRQEPLIGIVVFPYTQNGLFYEFGEPEYKTLLLDNFERFQAPPDDLEQALRSQFGKEYLYDCLTTKNIA